MGRMTEVVKVLLILNVIFYVGSNLVGADAYNALSLYYFENAQFRWWQPITHMFMHSPYRAIPGFSDGGSILHIVFNMYALWAFGTAVERRFGPQRFLTFYLIAGIGAAFIHSFVGYLDVEVLRSAAIEAGATAAQFAQAMNGENAQVVATFPGAEFGAAYDAWYSPAVGASGAIFGILVAFAMLYPNAELMLLFIPFPIKAKYLIGIYVAYEIYAGFTGTSLMGANIANWAHIGGALFGFVMAWWYKRNDFDEYRWN